MQYLQFVAARWDTGVVLPHGLVTVYLEGTATKAALFNAAGVAIGNPVVATSTGGAGFSAANGFYDIEVVSADGLFSAPRILHYQFFDPVAPSTSATSAATAYTLSDADNAFIIFFTASTPITVTVAPGLREDFAAAVVQFGLGRITISAGAGVTLGEIDGSLKSEARYARLNIIQGAPNSYLVDGRTTS